MSLPILNLGFKTQETKRVPHFSKDLEDWYAGILAQEKETSPISDKKLIDLFLRRFYTDTTYRAKVVARQEGCIIIEVFRWLEITKQAQGNHLWLLSLSGVNYIKL